MVPMSVWDFFTKNVEKAMFEPLQGMGFHLLRNHFYHPIPDTSEIDETIFEEENELVGIDIGRERQLDLLRSFQALRKEYEAIPQRSSIPHQYRYDNTTFRAVDAEVLYCLIRQLRPKKIIEIGSGYSTLISAQALEKNKEEGSPGELIAIEPYPNQVLRDGFPGLTELRAQKLQEVDSSEFTSLGPNDILFMDSTHVLKLGSDVQYEYLQILPRLNPGVFVHVHDIFLPREYPRDWVMKAHRFWNEQYLLQPFLSFNSSFQVVWAGFYMHLHEPEAVAAAFPAYDPKKASPGSFWIKRTK